MMLMLEYCKLPTGSANLHKRVVLFATQLKLEDSAQSWCMFGLLRHVGMEQQVRCCINVGMIQLHEMACGDILVYVKGK